MDELEELLEQLINPESDGDTSGVYDGLRNLFSGAQATSEGEIATRDNTINEHVSAIAERDGTVEALTIELAKTKAANYDLIMANSRDTESIDPDIPSELDENDDEHLSYEDAFTDKED